MKINIMIAVLFLIFNTSSILIFTYYCKLPQLKLFDNESDFNECDFKINNIIKKINQQVTGK